MQRYAAQKPDLIVFSSMYHGGLSQEYWAYSCRSFFAGAICNDQSRILNPFGETVAASTNYYPFVTGRINLDYALVHIDRNGPKYFAAKQKYGDRLVMMHQGSVVMDLTDAEKKAIGTEDILRKFTEISVECGN